MILLRKMFEVLDECTQLSTAGEIKSACELIMEVQDLDSVECATLKALFKEGPLWDGDVPSKQGRDRLLAKGFAFRVVNKGETGFNACTYKGADAYRLLIAGA